MMPPRILRERAARKRTVAPEAESNDKPQTYHATSGSSSTDRVSRRFERGERDHQSDFPIVMGFRPNEERI